MYILSCKQVQQKIVKSNLIKLFMSVNIWMQSEYRFTIVQSYTRKYHKFVAVCIVMSAQSILVLYLPGQILNVCSAAAWMLNNVYIYRVDTFTKMCIWCHNCHRGHKSWISSNTCKHLHMYRSQRQQMSDIYSGIAWYYGDNNFIIQTFNFIADTVLV